MMNIKKLLTVGGDERMLYTSQSLAEKGFDVEIFASSPPAGFENMCPTGEKSIDSAAARSVRGLIYGERTSFGALPFAFASV